MTCLVSVRCGPDRADVHLDAGMQHALQDNSRITELMESEAALNHQLTAARAEAQHRAQTESELRDELSTAEQQLAQLQRASNKRRAPDERAEVPNTTPFKEAAVSSTVTEEMQVLQTELAEARSQIDFLSQENSTMREQLSTLGSNTPSSKSTTRRSGSPHRAGQ